jgi:hypothetical protein
MDMAHPDVACLLLRNAPALSGWWNNTRKELSMAVEYKERRQHPRYVCDTGVRVHPEKGNAGYWGTVSDISFGGCYIYTFSPLPVGQTVTLVIKIDDAEVNVGGRTVSCHPGVGMGVAFQSFVHEDGEARLKAYIDRLAAQPKPKDQVAVFH